MTTQIELEKELELLAKELEGQLSIEQIHKWALETEFMKRKSKLKPEHFLLLCTFLKENIGEGSLTELCAQLTANFKVNLTTEGLNQRFNPQAVEFMKQLYHALWMKQLAAPTAIVEKRLFRRIRILDSSSFDLSAVYPEYKGPNGSGAKIQLEYELYQGNFLNLEVQEGKESDNSYCGAIQGDIQPGDLCLRDLGYFSRDNLLQVRQKDGYFLSRIKNSTNLYRKNDQGKWEKLDLIKETEALRPGEVMELNEIRITAQTKEPLIARVIFVKLTAEQQSKRQKQINKKKKKGKSTLSSQKNISFNMYVTNIPQEMVKKEEIYDLYSLRWQIEILFKTWKSLFGIHRVKKVKKERFECHLYGTLIKILLCSTFSFQCRKMLYIKHQMEASEYKSISIAKQSLSVLVSVIIGQKESLLEIWKSIYQSIKTNGRKCRKQKKQTVFDILKISCEQILSEVA